MRPRAAWRLTQLGFDQVYDYTAGKIDWIAAGWATEGPGPAEPRVVAAVDPNLPTCRLDEKVGTVRHRLGPEITTCVVVTIIESRRAVSNTSTLSTWKTPARSAR
jgi:hypothetical protein